MAVLHTALVTVWVMLPAYVPNNAAVLLGGGVPVDGGRIWGGARLLGDGKTWRGTVAGLVAGVGTALVLNVLRVQAGTGLPRFPFPVVVALPLGALLGDMAASFVKRRVGTRRGAPFPGVDQYDFVVGALLCAFLAAPAWFTATFTVPVVVTVLVLTPVLHVTTNRAAYRLGWKDEPW